MAGWAAFLLILPFFSFLETPSSFLAAFFREKKRRVWKDLQTGYKTDFDLKQFFKVCKY
jgi:hypothetical protein